MPDIPKLQLAQALGKVDTGFENSAVGGGNNDVAGSNGSTHMHPQHTATIASKGGTNTNGFDDKNNVVSGATSSSDGGNGNHKQFSVANLNIVRTQADDDVLSGRSSASSTDSSIGSVVVTPTAKRSPPLFLATTDLNDPPLLSFSSPFVPRTPGTHKSTRLTALHVAVQSGSVDAVEAVMSQDLPSSIDAQDENGWTPLMNAAALGPHAISAAMVKKIAPLCPHINIADLSGYTALHWAAAMGNAESIGILLDNGADVDCQGIRGGETALHRASRFMHFDVIRLLASRGATIIHNGEGLSPFDVAGKGHTASTKSARKKVIKALYEAFPSARTMLLTHKDCFGHTSHKEHHQEAPQRITAVVQALRGAASGIVPDYAVTWLEEFPKATYSQLQRAHTKSYIRSIENLCKSVQQSGVSVPLTPYLQKEKNPRLQRTKAPENCDTSLSVGSFDAALRACGAAIHAVDNVVKGNVANAFCVVRPPGHHAGPSGLVDEGFSSCGFCIFNTIAVAALHALTVYGSGPLLNLSRHVKL